MGEKYIILNNGQKTIVDEEDFESFGKYKWCLNNSGYVFGYGPCKKVNSLHRYIMSKIHNIKDKDIDHINKNKLDNRKFNLRICNKSQNNSNTEHRKINTSGYKGVSFNKTNKLWCAKICFNNKHVNIGLFETARLAAIAYDLYSKFLFKEFAVANIIEPNKNEVDLVINKITKEHKRRRKRKSKYYGIEFKSKNNTWTVRINRKNLGTFNTEIEAAQKADEELLRIGDNFHLNFNNKTTLEDVIKRNFNIK